MQTINLNQNSFRLFPTIYMVQNDTGRSLKMILDDVTLDGTETGAVAIKRSDGSYYTITATIDATNNAFDADMTQALTQPSRTECQLKVTDSNNDVISTYTFIIQVQESTDGLPAVIQEGYSVGDLIEAAEQLSFSGNDTKQAILQIAQKTAYIDANGQTYYNDLYNALYPPVRATSVTLDQNSLGFSGLNQTQTLTATVSPENVYDDTVYWGTSDPDVAVVSDGVVTSVGVGDAIITATCGTKHADAAVSVATANLLSISAAYTQSGTVYSYQSLDDLKTDLVVTAYWDDSTSSTVAASDYVLTGSLDSATSTVTVSYGGKTATFTVSVTVVLYQYVDYASADGDAYVSTGIVPRNTMTELKFKLDTVVADVTMCGKFEGSNQRYYVGNVNASKNFTFVTRSNSITSIGAANTNVHTQILNNASHQAIHDGVVKKTSSDFACTSGSVPIYLFTRDGSGKCKGRIYYATFTDNDTDTVLGNFRPAKRISDDVVGFWDTVSQTFFTPVVGSLGYGEVTGYVT